MLAECCTWAADSLRLRRVLLPVLRRVNPGDITVRHHWTGDLMRLHSFKHKGYWYYGRKREYDSMAAFQRLLTGGDVVIDVGAHIGYMAVFFGDLVGPSGHVYAFEPGPNNLPYARRNCANGRHRNITLIEMAASSSEGHASLYIETLTGQNNSLLSDYAVFAANAEAHGSRPDRAAATVETIRLDSYVKHYDLRPALVKIDVEGAEATVLDGARETLRVIRPALMVEVTQRHAEVARLLLQYSYRLFSPTGAAITELTDNSDATASANVFAIPEENRSAIVRFLEAERV